MQQHRFDSYVVLAQLTAAQKGNGNWIYLRRHSDNTLFAGNLQWPFWLPMTKTIGEDHQQALRPLIKNLFPGAKTVRDVFSTGNGRLAVRVEMCDADALNALLSHPDDHVYLPASESIRLMDNHAVSAMETLARWLRDHEADRDEKAVTTWSEAAMRTYETRERFAAEEKAKRDKKGSVPDEDGFVTVTNGAPQMKLKDAKTLVSNQRNGRRIKTVSAQRRNAVVGLSKEIVKTGPYRWQSQNMGTLVQLRDKFRDDQKRVAAIAKLKSHAQGNPNLSNDGRDY